MDHTVNRVPLEAVLERCEVTDIDTLETVVPSGLNRRQIAQVARVGQAIDIHKQILRVFRHQVQKQVGPINPPRP